MRQITNLCKNLKNFDLLTIHQSYRVRNLYTTTKLRAMSTLNLTSALNGPFNFINNQRCDPIDSEGTFENLEPRSGLKLSNVNISGLKEVDRAVKAAKASGVAWSKVCQNSLLLM